MASEPSKPQYTIMPVRVIHQSYLKDVFKTQYTIMPVRVIHKSYLKDVFKTHF